MNHPSRLLAAALCLTAAAASADAVYVSIANQSVLIGQGVPAVSVQILEPIAGFRLKLKRSDGKLLDIKGGGSPGTTRMLDLMQPEGKFEYEGELIVNEVKGDTSSMPLKFEAALLGPLRMKIDKKDVDIEGRKLVLRLNRPVSKVHLKVQMDTGKMAINGDVLFNGEPADTPIEVTWPEAKGKVMTVNVQAYDTQGFFAPGIELSPWFVNIPHDDVNFDSAKWDIRPDQRDKLDNAWRLIDDAVTKYGQWAELKLYIAGHTDTVGGTQYNRGLSLNRAKSIGAYFRRKGLRIPVYFVGFGEEALAVQTADETDEARNRRADYTLSIDTPQANGGLAPKWQRL